MTKKYRGFTLVELLVVIAIIGILASIVLVSLSTARNRAYDAEIQSELSQVRADAELYYLGDGNGDYTDYDIPDNLIPPGCSGDCTDTLCEYKLIIGDPDDQTYAAWGDLCGQDGSWCVDSAGNAKVFLDAAGDPVVTAAVCP